MLVFTKIAKSYIEDYMEGVARKVMGEYYDCIKYVSNMKDNDPIQARVPFELNIR